MDYGVASFRASFLRWAETSVPAGFFVCLYLLFVSVCSSLFSGRPANGDRSQGRVASTRRSVSD